MHSILAGGNVDFYLPSLLACIAALVESRPVGRNQFPWHPRRVLIAFGGRKSLRTVVRLLAGAAVWWAVRYPRPSDVFVPRVPDTLRRKVSPPVGASLNDLKCFHHRILENSATLYKYLNFL